MAGTEHSTVAGRLTELARRSAAAPETVLGKARIVVGDALALALESRDSPAGRTALALAGAAPAGPATVVGMARGVETGAAVLAGSVLIHAQLRDDAHAGTLLHPAAVVVPVALALAEETSGSAELLVEALVAGYEVMVAVAAPVAAVTAARGLRNTAVFGPFGAAAAAATVLGLDDERFRAALLIAGGSAGGTLQAFRIGAPDWRFQPGLAARLGVEAARLAAALDRDLLPVPAEGLESEHGLYAVLAGATVDPVSAIPTSPGALAQVTHKLHATCGANQVPVAAVAALAASGVTPHDVDRIDVWLSRASFEYPGCEDYGPFTEGATFLSRPFALAATMLSGGGPLDEAQSRAALRDPRLEDLAHRVVSHVVADAELSSPQDARVEVLLRDGTVRRLSGDELDADALHPGWPAIARRVREADAEAGPALVAALEQLPDIDLDALTAPLRGASSRSETA